MKYCSSCGSADLKQSIPEGDNRLRFICPCCEEIFYHNPKMVVGCIAEWQDKVLMCKRAIEPRYGKWTLPAGFMENEETVHDAAARETQEEATAEVTNMSLYTLYNLPYISQVYVMFRADLVAGKASPGIESLEVALMEENEIPWDDLAFPVIRESLLHYFADKRKGEFQLHYGDISRLENNQLDIKHY